MLGGYCKGNLIRKKLNELNSLTEYDEVKIKAYTEQIKCMLDLELLTLEDANVTLTMYKRLEEADKWKSLNKEE